jgi:excisionase family DNA binding protein
MRHEQSELLWTIDDAAAYLRVPVSSVYKMTARKARLRIPHIRIAGRIRFRKTDLDSWLELLSISNLGALKRMHKAARKAGNGHYQQEEDREW